MLTRLRDGLPHWPGSHSLPLQDRNGACQAYLYSSYMFRFMSAWFIVIFAAER